MFGGLKGKLERGIQIAPEDRTNQGGSSCSNEIMYSRVLLVETRSQHYYIIGILRVTP